MLPENLAAHRGLVASNGATYNKIRDEYVAQHHHSLDEIVADLRRRQAEHPERIVDRRRPPPTETGPQE
jgi:hypothetical protein